MSFAKPLIRSIAIVVAAILLLLLIYMGSYFAVAERGTLTDRTGFSYDGRAFAHAWQEGFYQPAVDIESFICRKPIGQVYRSDEDRRASRP